MFFMQGFVKCTHQVVVINQIKPLTSDHDRNWSYTKIIMQFAGIFLNFLRMRPART